MNRQFLARPALEGYPISGIFLEMHVSATAVSPRARQARWHALQFGPLPLQASGRRTEPCIEPFVNERFFEDIGRDKRQLGWAFRIPGPCLTGAMLRATIETKQIPVMAAEIYSLIGKSNFRNDFRVFPDVPENRVLSRVLSQGFDTLLGDIG